jgi:hypothetical protein
MGFIKGKINYVNKTEWNERPHQKHGQMKKLCLAEAFASNDVMIHMLLCHGILKKFEKPVLKATARLELTGMFPLHNRSAWRFLPAPARQQSQKQAARIYRLQALCETAVAVRRA